MAPGSASGKHPFYVVCKCGPGCCVCGGRLVGVGAWGFGLLVMLHVRALFVGGGGCVWVKCPCGGSGPHPGCWVLVLVAGGVAVRRCGTLLCFALLYCVLCVVVCCEFHCVPLPALACCVALCATLPP